MNRIDRLVAILVYLQSKRLVTASDIAARFEISLRTVYRDVKALEETGIPIIGEAGRGYSIESGYHLPPVMFTRDEAAAMITAGKMIEKLSDASLDKFHNQAMEKVRAVLRYSDKEFIETLENHILVFQPSSGINDDSPNIYLSKIQKALINKHLLNIEYYSPYNNEASRRQIEPIGICFYSSRWHLIGFCRLRNEYRDFRIDRIKQLVESDEIFSREHPPMKDYFTFMGISKGMIKVVVRFSNEIAKSIAESKYYFGFLEEESRNGSTEMTFLCNTFDWIANWLLSFGCNCQVLEPLELKTILKNKVLELADYYK